MPTELLSKLEGNFAEWTSLSRAPGIRVLRQLVERNRVWPDGIPVHAANGLLITEAGQALRTIQLFEMSTHPRRSTREKLEAFSITLRAIAAERAAKMASENGERIAGTTNNQLRITMS